VSGEPAFDSGHWATGKAERPQRPASQETCRPKRRLAVERVFSAGRSSVLAMRETERLPAAVKVCSSRRFSLSFQTGLADRRARFPAGGELTRCGRFDNNDY